MRDSLYTYIYSTVFCHLDIIIRFRHLLEHQLDLDAGFESDMVDLYVTLNTMLLKIVHRLTQFVH